MSTISKNTFIFLQDLEEYGTKEWFENNRERYEASKTEMTLFADDLIEQMNQVDLISTPSGKKSIYRIFRDVRFSKNKNPYKNHWSGGLARATASRRGGFYFHIEPGNSYVEGGFFSPNSDDLLLMRKQIELDATPLRDVLNNKSFKHYFGELRGSQLKTAPKGFDKEHENIDLLRYKTFTVNHPFSDEEVLQPDFSKQVASAFTKMLPFFDVMTDYLTTDLNGESLLTQ